MGGRRLAKGRFEAILENLNRSLDFNGSTLTDVIINTARAVTLSGTNTLSGATTYSGAATVTGVGLESIKISDAATITVGIGTNTDTSVTIPAGAMITDYGVIFPTATDCAGSSTLTLSVGLSAAGTELLGTYQLNQAGQDIGAGAAGGNVFSVALGNKIDDGAGSAPSPSDNTDLFFTVADTIHARITVGGAELTSNSGTYRFYVKYVVVA